MELGQGRRAAPGGGYAGRGASGQGHGPVWQAVLCLGAGGMDWTRLCSLVICLLPGVHTTQGERQDQVQADSP